MHTIKTITAVFLCSVFFHAAGPASVFAADTTDSANTETTLEQRVSKLEQSAGQTHKISDKFTLSGTIELDYSYANDNDVSDNTVNDSTSDLDISTVSLGLDAELNEYVSASVVLKGEDIDSNNDRIFWDEIFVTFAKEGIPVYVVAGKRTQPFGLFKSLFINDPITQELYEINKAGITVGYADEKVLGIDLSFTLYKGETLITRLNDADYGWARDNSAGYAVTNDMSSYIISMSVSPVENLTLAAYYSSEPGDTDRNTTFGGSLHVEMADFIADAEYIGALNREKHITDNKEYNETAWFVSFGYQVADPLTLAVRYEDFDADKIQSGNLDYRYGVAATYMLFQTENFTCNLLGEYRRSEYEHTPSSSIDQNLDEYFARLSLEF